MNLSELQTLVLSWLDDPNGTYFTPAQTLVWLNNAQREVQKQIIQAGQNWYVTRAYTTTGTDLAAYSLPDDFLKVNKLEVVLSGEFPNQNLQLITPVTLVKLDQCTTKTGPPSVYVLKNNCLLLRPVPDQVYRLQMYYTYRVTDMVNPTDVPDVPEQYQEYIALLATFDGFMKDQRDPNPMLKMKADMYVKRMIEDANDRTVDQPRMVRQTEMSDYGWLF